MSEASRLEFSLSRWKAKMMECHAETALERVAIQLAGQAIDTERETLLEWARSNPGDPSASIVLHAQECPRCGEILRSLLEIERSFMGAEAREGSGIVLRLSAPGRPARAHSAVPRPTEAGAQSFDLAAESADPGNSRVDARILDVTLASDDGRYLIRVKPAASGAGAVAVLLSQRTGSEVGRGEEPASPPMKLHVAGRDYEFDKDGLAHLPGFPSGPVYLVGAGRADSF